MGLRISRRVVIAADPRGRIVVTTILRVPGRPADTAGTHGKRGTASGTRRLQVLTGAFAFHPEQMQRRHVADVVVPYGSVVGLTAPVAL